MRANLQRVTAACLAGVLLNIGVFAYADTPTMRIAKQVVLDREKKETQAEDVTKFYEATADLGVQLNDLYHRVGKELNLDYMYVKMIHLVADGKAVYSEEHPNIYNELTVQGMKGAFEIEGVEQEYTEMAKWAVCPDPTIQRPSKYYLPDAAYNVSLSVVREMNKRYYYDRGALQSYFDSLKQEARNTILFYEGLLAYTGATESEVNNFYRVYEKLLFEKDKNENVLETNGKGEYKFKDRFLQIFKDNGYNDKTIKMLEIVLSFDSSLAASDNIGEITEGYVTPYKLNYTSRENMMLAAMSLVGKVRYVWGGGHLDTGTINGINPIWKPFADAYGKKSGEEGFQMCMQPLASWHPITGHHTDRDGGLPYAKTVYSFEEYLDSRKEGLQIDHINPAVYSKFMKNDVAVSRGIVSNRLDGLDCSGFASWVYNQVTEEWQYDYGAFDFVTVSNLNKIPLGETLKTGDVFAWDAHIVVIVGEVVKGGKAYTTLEATPNMVKFGTVYYSGVSSSEFRKAKQIADEANILLGGMTTEPSAAYNLDTTGRLREDGTRMALVGRLPYQFLDEDTILKEGKRITDMTSTEIIQHTIISLPLEYISGAKLYRGQTFTVDKIGEEATEEKQEVKEYREKEKLDESAVESLFEFVG